jgi:hypothetical protein
MILSMLVASSWKCGYGKSDAFESPSALVYVFGGVANEIFVLMIINIILARLVGEVHHSSSEGTLTYC